MKVRTKVNVGQEIPVGYLTRDYETVYGYELEVTRDEWGRVVAQIYAEVDLEVPVRDYDVLCACCEYFDEEDYF